jgi:predicted MFS family arabinose efflux permease
MRASVYAPVDLPLLRFSDGWRLFAVTLLGATCAGVYNLVLPWTAMGAGVSAGGAVALSTAASFGLAMAAATPAGAWADRIGTRRALRMLALVQLAAIAGAGALTAAGQVLAGALLATTTVNLSFAGATSAANGAVCRLVTEPNVSASMSQLMLANQLGLSAGPALGGLLLAVGARAALAFVAAASVVGAAAAFKLRPELLSPRSAPQSLTATVRDGARIVFAGPSRLLRVVFWGLAAWNFGAAFLVGTMLAAWMRADAHFTPADASVVLFAGIPGSVLSAWLLGHLRLRAARRLALAACTAMATQGILFCVFPLTAGAVAATATAYALVMCANTTTASTSMAAGALDVPPHRQSVALALVLTGCRASYLFGGLAAGAACAALGLTATIMVGGAMLVLTAGAAARAVLAR